MAFNNRNRSLLSLVHHTDRDLLYLLRLVARSQAGEILRRRPASLAGKNIALIFEKTLHAHPLCVRGGGIRRGCPRHLHRPPSSQIGHMESMRTSPSAGPCMTRSSIAARTGVRRGIGGVRRCPGIQRFDRRVPPHADAGRRAHHDRALPKAAARHQLCVRGDGRNNVANSLLLVGAKLGMDVRIGAPQELWPTEDHITMCHEFAAASGARITVTDDPVKAVSGVDFIYTDVWVSKGEPVGTWGVLIEGLMPFQVSSD